jgi:DNA-binding transcriptional LysR family regulator
MAEELELGLASLIRDGRDAEVSGTVRVSLSEGFVRPLVPLLARLQAKHPALRVEVISESRIADLARGEADIGIRIARSASAPIVSKSLGRASTGLFASREYVERRLPGARLSRDVAGMHDWVGLDASLERLPQEQWMRAYGASRFTFRSNSVIAIEQAVVSGMGIGLLGVVQASSLTGLVKIDIETTPPPVEVFLAFRRDARRTSRVRVVAREIEADARRLLRSSLEPPRPPCRVAAVFRICISRQIRYAFLQNDLPGAGRWPSDIERSRELPHRDRCRPTSR